MVPVPKVLVGYKCSKEVFIAVIGFQRFLACDGSPSNLVPVGDCGGRRGRQLARNSIRTVRDTVQALGTAIGTAFWSLGFFALLLELCVHVFDGNSGYRGRSGSGRCNRKA